MNCVLGLTLRTYPVHTHTYILHNKIWFACILPYFLCSLIKVEYNVRLNMFFPIFIPINKIIWLLHNDNNDVDFRFDKNDENIFRNTFI